MTRIKSVHAHKRHWNAKNGCRPPAVACPKLLPDGRSVGNRAVSETQL